METNETTLKAELTLDEIEVIFAYRKISNDLKDIAKILIRQLSGEDITKEFEELKNKLKKSKSEKNQKKP